MKPNEVTVEWLLDHLEEFEWDEASGTGMAWCPAHDDVGTSMKGLSVTRKRGKLYAYCHSCHATLTQVIETAEGNGNGSHTHNEPAVHVKKILGGGLAWWVGKTGVALDVWERLGVVEVPGGVAFTFAHTTQRKVRLKPKQITWAHTDLDAPALWPHPDDDLPPHIMLVEGESDCGTAHAAGLPHALATTKGAGAAFPENWTEGLKARGVHHVTICGDTDETGRKFEARLSQEALAAGLEVSAVRIGLVVDPFSSINDLNGLWRAADSTEQFLELVERATVHLTQGDWALTYEEVLALAEEEVDFLVPGLVAPSDKVLLVGPQKSYKTWMALDLIRTLVTGRPFLNRPEWTPEHESNVLLIEEEGSPKQFARRLRRMQLTEEQFTRLRTLHRKGIRFTDDDSISRVIAYARQAATDVIVFDPLQRMMPGVDENSSSETGIVWDQVMRIQQALPHVVVVIIHHANKGERLTWESVRGSSRHAGEVDLGLFVERDQSENGHLKVVIDGRDVALDLDAGHAFDVEIQINEEGFSLDAGGMVAVTKAKEGRGSTQRDKVLDAVRDGQDTRTKIMRATNLSDTTVRTHLTRLHQDGLVNEQDGVTPRSPKTYTLADQ